MNDEYANGGGMPPADPMAMGGDIPMDEPMEPQGFSVCIYVDPEGSMSVGTLPGPPPGAETFSPAADNKDALTQALEIIKAGGDATAASPKAAQSASFQAGYEEG